MNHLHASDARPSKAQPHRVVPADVRTGSDGKTPATRSGKLIGMDSSCRMNTAHDASPGARPVLLVISGPAGSGKTTVLESLVAEFPGLRRVLSCTTRAPRGTEKPAIDYHFLSVAEFDRRVLAGEFLEHTTVHGNRYGLLRASVFDPLAAGHDVALIVDPTGHAALRDHCATRPETGLNPIGIFIEPADLEVLRARLISRGTDTPAATERRLAGARAEIARAHEYPHRFVSADRATDYTRVRSVYLAAKRQAHT